MENMEMTFTEECQYNNDIAETEVAEWNLSVLKNLKHETEKLLIELKSIMDHSDIPVKCQAIVMEIDKILGEFESIYSINMDLNDEPIHMLMSNLKEDVGALKNKLKSPEDGKDSHALDVDVVSDGAHIMELAADDDGNCVEDRCASDDSDRSAKHGYSSDESKTAEELRHNSRYTTREKSPTCLDGATLSHFVVILSSVSEDVQTAHTMCGLRGRLHRTSRAFDSRSTAIENLAIPTMTSRGLFKDSNVGHGFQWTTARDRDLPRTETRVDPSIKIAAVVKPAGRFTIKTTIFILFAALVGGYYCWNSGRSKGLSAPDYSRCAEYDGFRCENNGLLIDNGTNFACECASGYYGEHCAYETYLSLIYRFVNGLLYSDVFEPNAWWSFLPFTLKLQQKTIFTLYQDRMKNALNKFNDGGQARPSGADAMTYTRILPANRRSSYCPAESHLPPLDSVYDQIFQQKSRQHIVDTKKQNLLLHTFYRYFVLQFFGPDFNSTVTGSQLYGSDDKTQKDLRSWSNGKLRTEDIDGQQYLPQLSFAEKVTAIYYGLNLKTRHWFDRLTSAENLLCSVLETRKARWALGHPFLSSSPLLFAMNTLWVREHNRVCDELVMQWPEWTDEQVYGTARRIVIGEMMGIMVGDVLHTGNPLMIKHDPEVYENVSISTAPFELLLTTLLPIGLPQVPSNENVFHSTIDDGQISGRDVDNTIKFMIDERTDMQTSYNDDPANEPLTKLLIRLSRENSVQGFNDYLRHLGLRPYLTFYELTRDQETADTLVRLYRHVDMVELLTGMLVERKRDDKLSAFNVLADSFIMNSILKNSLNSKTLWKPNTFGGDRGFDIVKSANMKSFIKNNLIDDFVVGGY